MLLFFFIINSFICATLLFWLQPMFARMVLPLLGGSPAVWSTAMVFYQAALLAGYAYAHWTLQKLGIRRQIWLHLAVLLIPFAFIPVAVPEGWIPPSDTNPVPWLLLLLLFGVGIPFFAMATSSPILQRWFFATRHPSGEDPYFLYAASNAGSVIALLSYPLLIEPNLTVAMQSRLWAWGYGIAFLITLVCALYAIRDQSRKPVSAAEPVKLAENKPTWRLRSFWLLLAFIPCSLMLGVTTFITTDLAAVPLLWVIPLTLYLLSFIFVFSRKQWLPLDWMSRLLLILAIPMVLILTIGSNEPLIPVILISLAFFFTAAVVCHGRLAASRPSPEHLTDFYLCLSLGGVLGGAFNALLAPVLFTGVAEYPLAVALACLFGTIGKSSRKWRETNLTDFAVPLGLGVLTVLIFLTASWFVPNEDSLAFEVMLIGIPLVLCYLGSRRPVRFGLGVGAILLAGYALEDYHGGVVYAERSFFGVHRINTDREERFFHLLHGSTFHGAQSRDPESRHEPITYYHRTGPIGQVFEVLNGFPENRIAAVGLGTGALTAYGKPDQTWHLYEIDPAVERIARDTRFFTYLNDSAAEIEVILGDARISLGNAPDSHYGLIVLDAYSSDAIPVHLLTREALQLYCEKLAADGLIALHISNLHLDLLPLAANLAHDAGLHHLFRDDFDFPEDEFMAGKLPSQWVLMAKEETALAPFASDFRWEYFPPDPAIRVWTDNYSSLFEVFRWRD